MSDKITVSVVNENPLGLPIYATEQSSGLDLISAEDIVIPYGQTKMIKTGLSVAIPEGWEIQIRSRSGLALKKQVIVLNSPGTIDADYRGPVNVILFNGGIYDFEVKKGDRIAQAVLCPVSKISWNLVTNLDETQRGSGGFGSTGV
jgi:dUTP pyrophosphatase